MEISLKRFTDESYINLIRQTAMCRLPELRPVAFKVGTSSNVLDIGNTVTEDMSEFISNVSSLDFATTSGDEFQILRLSANGTLTAGQIQDSEIKVLSSSSKEQEILHTLSSTDVEIYFRFASGRYTADENRRALSEQISDASSLVCINSRHCPIIHVSTNKLGEDGENVNYDFNILTKPSISEDEVFAQIKKILTQDFSQLRDIM